MPYKPYQTGAATTRRTRRSSAAEAETAVKEEPALAGLKEEAETGQEEEMVLEGEKEANTANTVEYFETGDMETTVEDGADNKNGCHEEESKKKPWMRVKDGGVKKISGEERRRKRNIRMKKLLTPKAPTMILHELLLNDGQGSPSYEVEAVQVLGPMGENVVQYTVSTTYSGQQFTGVAGNRAAAKNICAEKVLAYITSQSCGPGASLATPWTSLASLGLFKLFHSWQALGCRVPLDLERPTKQEDRPNSLGQQQQQGVDASNGQQQQPQPPAAQQSKPVRPLPSNHQQKHPVQLLNEVQGPLEVVEGAVEGVPPHCMYSLAITVQQQQFTGQARSKKEAKRAAALAALAALYPDQYSPPPGQPVPPPAAQPVHL